jgi:hypothetical protein
MVAIGIKKELAIMLTPCFNGAHIWFNPDIYPPEQQKLMFAYGKK